MGVGVHAFYPNTAEAEAGGSILSQSVGGLFVLLTVSFALQKLCNFMRSHLSILDRS